MRWRRGVRISGTSGGISGREGGTGSLQFARWLACSYSTATPFFYFILGLFHWLAAIQLHFLFWTYSTGLELFYCNTKVFHFFFGAIPLGWGFPTSLDSNLTTEPFPIHHQTKVKISWFVKRNWCEKLFSCSKCLSWTGREHCVIWSRQIFNEKCTKIKRCNR